MLCGRDVIRYASACFFDVVKDIEIFCFIDERDQILKLEMECFEVGVCGIREH